MPTKTITAASKLALFALASVGNNTIPQLDRFIQRSEPNCSVDQAEDWFPPSEEAERITPESVVAARELCDECPIKLVCLARALKTGDTYGIKGSLTGPERADVLRDRSDIVTELLSEADIDKLAGVTA